MLRIPKSYYSIKLLFDCITITLAFSLAHHYVYALYVGKYLVNKMLLFILLNSCFSWYIISKLLPLYEESRSRVFAAEMVVLLKAIIAQVIVTGFVLFFFFEQSVSARHFLIIYTFVLTILIPIERLIIRYAAAHKRAAKGWNTKNVLIVGAGQLGMQFYNTIINNAKFGYQIIGFVDDTKKPFLNGQYLGTIDELETIIQQYDAEEVIVALPNSAIAKIEKTIYLSERYAKRVRIIPDFYRFGSGHFKVTNFGDFPLITVRSLPLDDAENKIFKRIIDIFFTALLLIFCFSWLMPLIAILIKLNSKGPVFFKQERWGLNNKKIVCYKFRSMVIDSKDIDDNGKYLQATKNDSRITMVGKFLRKTNLDELPQLINVLLGNMSLVGPRPHPIPLNMESKDLIQHYMLRHLVKPGITGWAQINGARGETDTTNKMQQRINFDLWYIENWSIWLDFQIITQTVINMIKGDAMAY